MSKTFQIPEKWAFNHDGENVSQFIGLENDDRTTEIIRAFMHAEIESGNNAELLENGLNIAKPQNFAEMIYAVYVAGMMSERMRGKNDGLASVLSKMFE